MLKTSIKSFSVQIILLFQSYENSKSENWLDEKIKKFEMEINTLKEKTSLDYNTLGLEIQDLEHDILDYSLSPKKSSRNNKNHECGNYKNLNLKKAALFE